MSSDNELQRYRNYRLRHRCDGRSLSPAFWTSYAIILPFQFLTNWWLTSRNIVMYSPDAIVGLRIFSAPAEDLLFGFALLLGTMDMWEFWGRRGMQRDPRPNKKNKNEPSN
jgi:lycopene cyclase domain-containing protein